MLGSGVRILENRRQVSNRCHLHSRNACFCHRGNTLLDLPYNSSVVELTLFELVEYEYYTVGSHRFPFPSASHPGIYRYRWWRTVQGRRRWKPWQGLGVLATNGPASTNMCISSRFILGCLTYLSSDSVPKRESPSTKSFIYGPMGPE